ncbi:hypothetical protein [Streptomyces sp. 4F14]|uniref:hypothetical protein n=1 Tax=Streptomyces sp. 4F14 TaxID=3394380 RepID=UPI003A84088C
MAATGYVSAAGDTRKVDRAGDAMTGELALPDSFPDTPLSAASKGYVDDVAAGKVSGPPSATEGSVPRFAGPTGKIIAGSTVIIGEDGSVTIIGGLLLDGADLTVLGTGKGYRFRRGGGALDLEATGADLLISTWSDESFGDDGGTQRSYARLSADAHNTQWAGRFESVAGLYGAAVHTLDPTTGIAGLGAKNGLTNIRVAGLKDTPGAPAVGAWAAGDAVLDSAGAWHLCTAGGSPGSWT